MTDPSQLEFISDLVEALGAESIKNPPTDITETIKKHHLTIPGVSAEELQKDVLLSFYADESNRETFDDSFSKVKGLIGLEVLPGLTIYPRGITKTNVVMLTVPLVEVEGKWPREQRISEEMMKTHPALKRFASYEHFVEGARQWAIKRLLDKKLISPATASEADYRPSHPDLLLLLKQQEAHRYSRVD